MGEHGLLPASKRKDAKTKNVINLGAFASLREAKVLKG
jgi:hypothetical protein